MSNCTAILYQQDGADGYENCYLQSYTVPPLVGRAGWTYCLNLGSDQGTSSHSGGGDKGQIIGGVIGGVAGVTILLGAFLWWRRRQSRTVHRQPQKDGKPRWRQRADLGWRQRGELDADYTEHKELETRQYTAKLPGTEEPLYSSQRLSMFNDPSER